YLATPATRLEFSGSVSSQLRVHAESKDLDDLLPALSLVSSEPVESLPVRLQGGSAVFDGVVAGTMPAPSISGDLTLTRFEAEDRRFDRLTAGIELSSSSLRVFHAQLTQGRARIRFEGSVGLEDWKAPPSGAISAKATLNDLDLAQWNPNLRGTLTASAEVMGTVAEPRGAGTASVKNAVVFEQPLDRLEAQLAYAGKILEIRQARLHIGTVQIEAGGDLDRDGRIRFRASGAEMPIESLQLVQRHSPTARGRLQLDVTGAGQYQDRHFLLSALDGAGTLRGLTVDGKTVGDATLSTATRGPQLNFELRSNFLNAALEGDGQWRLEPGYAAQGSLRFSKVSLAAVRNWLAPAGNGTFRLEGSAAGIATLRGPAFEPSQWTASLELSELELIPRVEGQQQIKVRNEGPVTATIERGVAKIQTARLTGPSTQLDASGTIALDPAQPDPLDLRVSGGINLAILKDLQPDLIVSGGAALHVTIRGSFSQPLVNGRAELRNAAFNVADIATGLAQANGTILFSGSRATIESFTAETGGGKVQATGFLGFEAGLPSLRLQVGVSQVRIRYPEGVSTVVDAALTLAGTTRSSLLSGQVTVLRSGFAPHSDFSSLLSRSADPVRTPSSRTGPLGGLQFDVRVQSAPNISLESSLARDIQAEANLRLRGTPYNPLLLGNISITQGEITFFGTRYTVSQGSISFLNPVKLEPVLNLDVETRVRGIDVILTLSGPINKLNVTHRADPPLEFSEVVALLATGRTPASDPAVAALQASQPQSLTSLGAGDILGQAIANPVSSRLQRFFGVSKLKIDPKLTGIETNPQARLTLEQQVTKNLTFTYITDLTRSNQQIVRVEWNLNKEWSAVAIREENGLFGLDFLYKKSFK
ncbi:MAG: translocation/assembly module TamB domain-containing protein, partial [Acidobacteria bacterium]|nr:translocation/assembly module TamB domain-containing protein [Acidobacteriota bacterium]